MCRCSSSTRGSKIINNSPPLLLSQSFMNHSSLHPCRILSFAYLSPFSLHSSFLLRGRACLNKTDQDSYQMFSSCIFQCHRRCQVILFSCFFMYNLSPLWQTGQRVQDWVCVNMNCLCLCMHLRLLYVCKYVNSITDLLP